MKFSGCHGALMACLSFSVPSWAGDDTVAYVPFEDPVGDYLDAIDHNEAANGAYSTELADLYLGLGNSLLEQQEYKDAKKAFQQGVLITRVNFGLNSPGQTNYLFAVAKIESILGNRKSADKVLDDIYLINSRNYGENDPGMLPVLGQLLNWYQNNRPVDSQSNKYADLERSKILTGKMATIIEQDKGLGHPDTAGIYRKIGQIHWLTVKYVLERGISVEPGLIISTGAPPINVSTKSVSIKSLIAGGKAAFTKVVESVREDESRTPLEYAEAIAQLGDWNLAFGKRKTASVAYQQAHSVLAEGTQSTELADAYFRVPTPVRFMREHLEPLADSPESAAGMMLDVSMTVTRGGRPRDIQILNPPEDFPAKNFRIIKRRLSDMRFRPRLSNGLPEETKDFIWHSLVTQLDSLP